MASSTISPIPADTSPTNRVFAPRRSASQAPRLLSSLLHASDLCGNRPRLEGRRNRACLACARTNDRRSRFHLLEPAMAGPALAFLHRLGAARNCMENIDDPDYYSCFILLRQWIVVCPWRLGDHCSTRVGLSDTIPYQHQSIHCSI